MATPKKTKKGSAAAKKTAAAHTTGDVTVDVATVAGAVNRLPPPTEAAVRAWIAQYPESYTLTLASQTRAPAVLAEGWGWFQKAEPALRGDLGKGVRYPLERLTFFGRCMLDLAGALDAERAKKRSNSSLALAVTSAEALAQQALSELRAAMREAAGRHPTMNSDLEARLSEASAATTAGALRALAALLDEWLKHTDENVRELAASMKLTSDDATSARGHADAMTQAATAKRGTSTHDRDTPEVSVHEGRLLAEMRVLRNAFLMARQKSGDMRIPALSPSAATRAIFGRNSTPEPVVTPVPAPAPAPVG